ncbi:MAG: efflux RND transporter periplasmic adaptor subunit [Candidatus Zhuqueibacterota bacterium]
MNIRKYGFLFFAVIAITVLNCQSKKDETINAKVINVRTAVVTKTELSIPIHTSGIVTANEEMKLAFKTGGIIAKIFVDDGATVKMGDILATLNLTEIKAQVNQAKDGYDKAERDFKRVKNLFADSVATLEQLQNSETARNVARSNWEIAEFNLKHSQIIAPAGGVILKRFAEENELISPGYPVFLFGANQRNWKIRAGLADRDIVKIKMNDSAAVALDAHPGQAFSASVSKIGEAANPMNGTYEIELLLNHTDQRLASGFVAKIDIFPNAKQALYLIPIEALNEAEGNGGCIYTIDAADNTAQKIPVTVVHVFDNVAAAAIGAENLTKVITFGSEYLTDGCVVNEVK